jgi:hypothetical protein
MTTLDLTDRLRRPGDSGELPRTDDNTETTKNLGGYARALRSGHCRRPGSTDELPVVRPAYRSSSQTDPATFDQPLTYRSVPYQLPEDRAPFTGGRHRDRRPGPLRQLFARLRRGGE